MLVAREHEEKCKDMKKDMEIEWTGDRTGWQRIQLFIKNKV